jgi:hypothetical protein
MTIYYLYVKTHRITGLKYLGKTKQDPYKYKGSGVYWTSHIKKHGYLVDTEIIAECISNESVKTQGEYYSNLWGIVASTDWANLKEESGDGGGAGIEGSKKISIALTGRKRPEHSKLLAGRKRPDHSAKMREKKGSDNHMFGKKQTLESNLKRSNKLKGISRPDNSRPKELNPMFGVTRPRLCCIFCKKEIDDANFKRWHGESCRFKK